jgi:heterodisulfide reductase subunit D
MGKAPTEPYKKVAASIKKSGNRFGTAKAKRTQWRPEGMALPDKSETLYFLGCVATFKSPEIAQSTAKLLHRGGLDFAVLGEEEWCCGNPLSASGQQEAFKPVVEHNIEAIKNAGAKRVLTSCACCYNVLRLRYPEVAGDLDFEVVHTTEILAGLIDEGKLKPDKSLTGALTYQDPCHLTRVNSPEVSLLEEPRKIIQSIPGVSYSEMEGNGMFTQCCGRSPYELPDLSLHTGMNRVKDAQAVGADTIVTSCAFCDWSLARAVKSLNADLRVTDVTTLLAQAMGL